MDRPVDAGEVLGAAPKPGQVEQYAAYRAAWRALGSPDVQRAEHEMSNGLHHLRIRAWERQKTWAPRYVANDLAGTRQTSDHHRRMSVLRDTEADAASAGPERDRLRLAACDQRALASTLDEKGAELERLDEVYHRWYLHTAGDRAAAEISTMILAERHAADDKPEHRVTAEEWLAVDQADRAAADADRAIEERDLDETSGADESGAEARELREITSREEPQRDQDMVRTPDRDDLDDTTRRASRAVDEIEAQEIENARADAEPHLVVVDDDVDEDVDSDGYAAV